MQKVTITFGARGSENNHGKIVLTQYSNRLINIMLSEIWKGLTGEITKFSFGKLGCTAQGLTSATHYVNAEKEI